MSGPHLAWSTPSRSRALGAIGLAFGAAVFAPSLADGSSVHLRGAVFDPLVSIPSVAPELALGARPATLTPYIVQFIGPVGQEESETLTALGGLAVAYLPENAYLVRLRADQVDAVRALAGVRWVGAFEPAWRLSPEIGSQIFQSPARREARHLTLRVRVFEDERGAANRFSALGATVLETIDDGAQKLVLLEAERGLLPQLAQDEETWWIEEQPEFIAWNNTTKWVVQSNTTGLTPIWDQGLHGEGQIVTVMDSGLDWNSCFFRDPAVANPGPTHRKVVSYSNLGGNTHDGCGTGHGTHVCGTVAGDQSYINPGNTNHAGMAHAAKLALQDVGDDGFLDCLLGLLSVPGTLTAAYNESYTLGSRIHTNSWGSTTNGYDTYCVNIDQFMWSHPEFLILFANGNSGPGGSSVGSPATAKNCVSVGSTDQAPNQNNVASYSSRGPASDQRLKPTVTAPGGQDPRFITSADNNSGNPPSPTCNTQGSPFQGTSMATPAVAGMAALVRQYFLDGFYPLGSTGGSDPVSPSGALVKAVLVNSGRDMGTSDQPNNNEGWGRILLDDGLYFEGDARELRIEQGDPLATGGAASFVYNVDTSDEPLEITLVWTDYPAASGAGIALVNDLDLVVTAPGGAQYKGNVYTGGQSTTGGTADRRNVEESVRLNNPPVGDYTISIQGFNVPRAEGQPFALAATGAFGGWPEDATGVEELAAVDRLELLPAEPNPARGVAQIRYHLPRAAQAELRIVGLDGRVVRTLHQGRLEAGTGARNWDGRDDAGRPAANGIYYIVLSSGREERTRKLAWLR
ncbi:MAG: S8 family serine peptidase [Candidatus Eisenbacteria bacterium]|nr:S8 family serine peptidase [Candidatus Eisenbacteria bacterium]